jgi:small-conductance mechanosensitive channel
LTQQSRAQFASAAFISRSEIILVLVALFVGVCPSLAIAQQSGDAAWVAAENVPSGPVIIDGRLLFRVRGVTAFPAVQRARGIEDRIRALAEDQTASASSLHLVEAEHSTDIVAGDQRIVSVFDADVRIEGSGLARRLIAGVYLKRIADAVLDYRAERAPKRLLYDTLLLAGATLGALFLAFLIVRLMRWLTARIEYRYQSTIRQIEKGSFRIISERSVWGAVHFMSRLLSLLAALALFYIYLHFALSLYPWTRGLAANLRAATLAPVLQLCREVLGSIPDVLVIAIIVFAARYLVRTARFFFSTIREGTITVRGFDRDWADPTFNIVRILIIAFAVVVCYPFIPGSESSAFKGVTIFIGVLFSLGSSSFLANLIAGYTMTYRRAFRVGDRIKIGDLIGDVTQVGLMVTNLRSLKNEEIVVPNSLILSSNLVNYSSIAREHGLILHTTVGIGYETPWRQVEAMLLIAAGRTPGLLREPRPFILQQSLGDYAVSYELNVYIDNPSAMYQLYTELHRSILDVFNEHNVQIMTPSYVADPLEAKVVPKDQWFAAPAQLPPVRKTGTE